MHYRWARLSVFPAEWTWLIRRLLSNNASGSARTKRYFALVPTTPVRTYYQASSEPCMKGDG